MKTTSTFIGRITIVIVISLLVLPTSMKAQRFGYQNSNMKYGIGISESISANGHGAITAFNFKVKKLNKELQIGVNYQNQTKSVAGLNLNLNKYLGDRYEAQNMYFSLSFRYFCNCQMSEKLNNQFHNSEYLVAIERFKTYEAFVAFGLKAHLSECIYIDNKLGFGVYYNDVVGTDNRHIPDDLFREDLGVGLLLSTGIHFEF